MTSEVDNESFGIVVVVVDEGSIGGGPERQEKRDRRFDNEISGNEAILERAN